MRFREIKELREQSEKVRDTMIELDEKLENAKEARSTLLEMLQDRKIAPELHKSLENAFHEYDNVCREVNEERKRKLRECRDLADELSEKKEAYEEAQNKAMYAQSKLLSLNMDTSEIRSIIDYTEDQLIDIDDVKDILNAVFDDDNDADLHKKKHLFKS